MKYTPFEKWELAPTNSPTTAATIFKLMELLYIHFSEIYGRLPNKVAVYKHRGMQLRSIKEFWSSAHYRFLWCGQLQLEKRL